MNVLGTIIGGNGGNSGSPDCAGTLESQDFNLIEDLTGCTFSPLSHDLTGVDPMLDPLAFNGGPTATHLPQPGSPVTDQGTCSSGAVTQDQRGEARPVDDAATADADDGCDIGAVELQEDELPVALADLVLEKTVDNPLANVGEQVTFTVTLTNLGPDDAVDVQVTDAEPAGLQFDDVTPSTGNYEAATGLWTVGDLANGAGATLTILATVTQAGTVTNTAEVTAANQQDPDETNNSASASVTGQEADLSLEKTVDVAAPNVGDAVVFTVMVTNDGPDEATGVTLDDDLPAGLQFASFNPVTDNTDTYDPDTGIIEIGALGNGQSATVEIVATVTQAGSITNTVTVDDLDQVDGNPNNDTDSVTLNGQQIDLELTKTVDDEEPNVGQQVVFSVTVTNNGDVQATGVAVEDVLPPGLSYVSDDGGSDTSESNGTVTWTVGSLAASGGSTTLNITAAVDQAGPQTNVAQVTAADQEDVDSTPGNDDGDQSEDDEDNATVDGQQIDLELSKTVDDEAPDVGQQVVFTLTVTNTGPSEATGVVVEDVLPAGLSYVSDDGSSDTSEDSGTVTWTAGSLAAGGGSATLEITATVDQPGPQTNVAQVMAADQPDADSVPGNDDGDQSEDDEDSATVDAPPLPADCANLLISDFSAAPDHEEFVDFTNEGTDTADLSQCVGGGARPQTNAYYVVFDFPETATLAPGETFRFGSAGVVDVDLVIPDGSIQNTNAALALLNRTSLDVGTPIADVQADVITSLVYFNENSLFGFFHREETLEQSYCTLYQGRLSIFAQGQCTPTVTKQVSTQQAAQTAVLQPGQDLMEMLAQVEEAAAQAEVAEAAVPEAIELEASYPNPFNPQTTIHFALPEAISVRLVVYDALGREVRVLVDQHAEAGRHAVTFEAHDLSSGVYFYRLETGGQVQSRQMLLMK